ncbi:helix-turn-helix domain-containing protein [Selenomonas ruminantium]|uniref:Transcriptional regulator, XRE family with cupin sensor n=1 Tax=Selenomonas ruminantium TaxID=971 RepID=A0A1I0Y3F9_SELRU|nr:XRE family transcriptional regulator [Selenomonas ruminantium]SFB06968.1 transcriptional regulator, XRE family with cupin sensor [Selenomonas ruminantium]
MSINEIIAANLQRLREERNLSFGQLSERSGVSKVMLSQIEKGEGNPTINTIWKVANGLEVDYSQLIAPPAPKVQIVRGAELPLQEDDNGLFQAKCYFPATASRRFDVFMAKIMPDESHFSEGHSPRTQEYVLVHQGSLEAIIDKDRFVLEKGDAVCFDCTRPHRFSNQGEEPVVFLDIVYYQ